MPVGNMNGQQRLQDYYRQQAAGGVPFQQARNSALLMGQGGQVGAGRQAPNIGQQMTLTPWQGQQPTGMPQGLYSPSRPGMGQQLGQQMTGGPNQVMSQFGQQAMPQQQATPQGPSLRVQSPNAAPGMAQHLSDLLSQRNQQTALDLNRGASFANANQLLSSQRARSGAGLGWAGIQASDQLAGQQNQFDIITALIRMLNNPLTGLLQ